MSLGEGLWCLTGQIPYLTPAVWDTTACSVYHHSTHALDRREQQSNGSSTMQRVTLGFPYCEADRWMGF